MTLQTIVTKLQNTPGFYECGSRAVAKRIGSDHVTKEKLEAVEKKINLSARVWTPGYKTPEPSDVEYWCSPRKPIIISEDTDYDFYCQFSAEAIALLDTLGFVPTWYSNNGDDYCDDMCKAVYTHEDYKVQVVVRDDALLYKAIFDNIPSDVYHDHLWKSSPTKPDRNNIKIWFNTFAAIAKAVQELK